MEIAIIGSGISGLGAAWALTNFSEHEVTVFEKDSRAGGHAATVTIDYEGTPIDVDTGFIVCNPPNYPNFMELISRLDVPMIETNMSFALSAKHRDGKDQAFEWNLSGKKAILGSLPMFLRKDFRKMVRQVLDFSKKSVEDLQAGRLNGLTLGEYCQQFGPELGPEFILPMGAAIWSTPGGDFRSFPAESFVRFFANHRILEARTPPWMTVKGGSREYVRKIETQLGERLLLQTEVTAVERKQNKVYVHAGKLSSAFDHVIFAGHSDQTLNLLSDAHDIEQEVLGAIAYKPNEVYLHRDVNLMPNARNKWGAWNYMDLSPEGSDPLSHEKEICVSYWMNKLQGIDASKDLFVTLNPSQPPKPELTFGKYNYSHPVFNMQAIDAQEKLTTLQGSQNCWFAGAWTAYGFHEDGLRSGINIAKALGANIPWKTASKNMAGPSTVEFDGLKVAAE